MAATTAIFAATAIVAGASAYQQSSAAKTQNIVDQSAINLTTKQNVLAARQRAAIEATQFRKALASQVSLASLRGGSGSLVRQFGFESMRSHKMNQGAINRGISIQQISGLNKLAGASARKSATQFQAWTGAASSILNSANLNDVFGDGDIFGGTKTKGSK